MGTSTKKNDGTLRLGQHAPKTDEAIWLSLVFHNGNYVTWGEPDDVEVRELLKIPADKPLPGIKIRRWNHPTRTAYFRDGLRRYRKLGTIPPEVEEKLTRESAAHGVLIDWQRLALGEDGPQPYTPELGSAAFKLDPDFYEAIVQAAITEENFRVEAIKEDAASLGES